MPETSNPAGDRRPLLLVVVGRQRVGKTTLLNTAVQFVRAHGGRVAVWNADMLNRSYSLSMFHADVLEPASADPEDVKAWLEDRFMHLAEHGYDAVLDVGGGDTPLARLVEEVPIVRTLERRGVRVVLVHVLGPEMADLDYLERFLTDGLLAPQATLVVLNNGLVLTGRSAGFAFAKVAEHAALVDAAENGARVVLMPKLPCMSAVTDRGMTFAEAMPEVSVEKPGHPPLSFFDRERVGVWWERELPKFFGQIPALWLPAMPGFERPEGVEPGATTERGAAPARGGRKREAAGV